MAFTPMISVKKADPNRSKIVTVIKKMVGPFSMEPVFIANHLNAFLTGKSRTNVHPTQTIRIHKAVRPDPALTRATLNARRVQPTGAERKHFTRNTTTGGRLCEDLPISFPTAAERTAMPTVVSSNLSSVKCDREQEMP